MPPRRIPDRFGDGARAERFWSTRDEAGTIADAEPKGRCLTSPDQWTYRCTLAGIFDVFDDLSGCDAIKVPESIVWKIVVKIGEHEGNRVMQPKIFAHQVAASGVQSCIL